MRCVLAVGLLAAGCFGGEGTLGGACEQDEDCGGEQTCARSICSLCGDGIAQAGELCLEGPTPTEAVAPDVVSIAILDVDQDGRVDLVWPAEGGLAVSLQAEDGFAAAQERPFDVTAVYAGDADADGATDLLIRDATGGASLWRPVDAGELTRVESIDLEPLRGLTAARLDPDLGVVARVGETLVRVGPGREPATVELGDEITHVVLAPSLNEAGPPDVVAVRAGLELVAVFVTDDGLQMQEPVRAMPFILDLAPLDWNGDGLTDVIALFDGGETRVYLSDGLGGFVPGAEQAVSASSERLLAFDATDDRTTDLLSFGAESDLRLAVRRGPQLDAASVLDDASWRFVAPVQVGADPRVDLVLYDGARFSILRRRP